MCYSSDRSYQSGKGYCFRGEDLICSEIFVVDCQTSGFRIRKLGALLQLQCFYWSYTGMCVLSDLRTGYRFLQFDLK